MGDKLFDNLPVLDRNLFSYQVLFERSSSPYSARNRLEKPLFTKNTIQEGYLLVFEIMLQSDNASGYSNAENI